MLSGSQVPSHIGESLRQPGSRLLPLPVAADTNAQDAAPAHAPELQGSVLLSTGKDKQTAEGCAMSPSCIALLGTVLCLGQVTPAQEEDLPRPSISAEPGPVVHPGSSVTFVCQGPPGVDIYRLEKKEGTSRYIVGDKEPLLGETEARFPITRASEDTEGHYRCVYYKGLRWSEFSGPLELQVTDEDTTQGPHPSAPSSQNYAVGNRVRMGLAGAVLLTLAAVLAEAWHSSGGPGKGPRAGDRTAPTGGI